MTGAVLAQTRLAGGVASLLLLRVALEARQSVFGQ